MVEREIADQIILIPSELANFKENVGNHIRSRYKGKVER